MRRRRRPRTGIGQADDANVNSGTKRTVPLWAAMAALIGTAFLFGYRKR
jgi:hypothetical protein